MAHWTYRYPRAARFFRSRAFLVVGPLLGVAALVGAGFGVVTIVANLPEPEPAPAALQPAPAQVEQPSAEPVETGGPAPESPPTSFTCWDGAPARDASACDKPSGEDGLKYLFPSLSENLQSDLFACQYTDYPKRDKFTFSYDCPLPGESMESTAQLIRYRYWSDTKASLKHYRGVYKDGTSEPLFLNGTNVGTVFRNTAPEEYGRYVIAFALFNGRMVMSIEGSDYALLEEMLEQARFRAPDEFYGYRGDHPTEARWEG